jgi:hypothetical protein
LLIAHCELLIARIAASIAIPNCLSRFSVLFAVDFSNQVDIRGAARYTVYKCLQKMVLLKHIIGGAATPPPLPLK